MNKEELRFKILDFTNDDLINCRNNILSGAILKKIKSHLIVSLIVIYFLIPVFTGLVFISYKKKSSFSEQIQPGGNYLYYFMILGCIALIIWLLFSLFSKHKKYSSLKYEKIKSIDVEFNDIQTASRGRYGANKYLILPEIEFTGFLTIKPPADLFDKEERYRFYFSSVSKILLATEQL